MNKTIWVTLRNRNVESVRNIKICVALSVPLSLARAAVATYTANMGASRKLQLISVEEYLAGELVSTVKHEYLGGLVFALAGENGLHNRIAMNIGGLLHAKLRHQRCQPNNSDTKIRVKFPTYECYYYPDLSVVCDSNPRDDTFQDHPVVIVEVASPSTRRIDEGEKKTAYLTLPSLAVYMIVEQDLPAVIVYRRTEQGFVREVHAALNASIPLPEIETHLLLAEIYEGVEFAAEASLESDWA